MVVAEQGTAVVVPLYRSGLAPSTDGAARLWRMYLAFTPNNSRCRKLEGEIIKMTEAVMTANETPDGRKQERAPWEKRHDNDGRGPIADNQSRVPDRDADLPEGSPGEAAPISGDGFQAPSGAVHPTFPDQGPGKTDNSRQ